MEDFKNIILKNTAWLVGSKIINAIIGYILIVAVARYLGDVGLGQYSFVFAFTSLTFIFADMGLSYLMIKEVSRNHKKVNYYFSNIFTLKIILGFLSLIITFIICIFLGKEPIVIKALLITALTQFFGIFIGFFGSFFNSFNKMEIESISSVIEKVVALILGLYFLYTTKSLIIFVFVLLISYFVRFLYLLIKIKNKINFSIKFHYPTIKEIIIKSFPFFLTGIFTFLYFRTDTVMLSLMKGDGITGWYNAAYKLIEVLSTIPIILTFAVLPSMSRLYKENKNLLKLLFERAFRYFFMIALPICIGTFILADKFIDLIYGTGFVGAPLSLQLLIWAELFIFVNYLMGNLLNSIDKEKYFTISAGACAIFNIILNFILIPFYSYAGAAIATILTSILNFLLLRKYIGKFLVQIKFKLIILKSLTAAVIMGFTVYYFKNLAVWYVVLLGAFIYFFVLILLKLEKEDKELITHTVDYIRKLKII